VKARSSLAYGHPAEAVTPASSGASACSPGATWPTRSSRRARSIRFDVVAVLPGTIEVIESAF
jgi:Holliday junction resolvase-like predicted endonuclease